jgi:hypothetical protein
MQAARKEEVCMAVIEKKLKLLGTKGNAEVVALFDSGASYSFIQPELARKLELPVRLAALRSFGTARKGHRLTARERITLDFALDGLRLSDEFLLLPGMSDAVIIGAATMQKWRMKLDFEHDRVILDPRVAKLRLVEIGGD